METIAIIQARMGSSRLSGKVLKKLGTEVVLKHVVERAKKIGNVDLVVVATSIKSQDDKIEEWCHINNVTCYRGDEDNVLQRFLDVINMYKPKYAIRITADCPFLDYDMAGNMLELIKASDADIVDIKDELPRGIVTEVFKASLLKEFETKQLESRHKEHVTYYAYEYENLFKRVYYKVPNQLLFPKLRITLDTEEDYEMLLNIAEHFNDIFVPTEKVVAFLNNNVQIANLNAHIEQKIVE